MKRTLIFIVFILILPYGSALAQQPSTPIPINLPSPTATGQGATETPTQTPTSAGPITAEAINNGTNVRAQPDINSERVGQISPGQVFAVVARRFDWFQIRFPDAPGGIGWVYKDVVTLSGDPAGVPELSLEQVPTEDLAVVSGRETLAAVSATPGGLATQTALALITPTGMFEVPGDQPLAAGGQPLPTFTFPAFTDTPINIQALNGQADTTVTQGGLPPIAPIVGLIGLGVLGLAVSLLRRM